jgi:MFS family permease
LTAGAPGDRIGAKRVFIAGVALFTLASIGCVLAPDLGVLVAARGVQITPIPREPRGAGNWTLPASRQPCSGLLA